jgi:Haem-binding domain
MKKLFKKIFSIGLICFILIQLYQPARNIDNGQLLPTHFTKVYHVPENVQNILQNSCYDCHSNHTNYRWYDYIQPARTLVESHIKNAKNDLNFSEWGNYGKRKQQTKLERMIRQIKANEMPLKSYTLIHSSARLNESEKKMLLNWLNSLAFKDN